MDINEAMKTCLSNGIKVYPKDKNRLFHVAIEENGKTPKIGKQSYSTRTINKAIINSWVLIAELIIKNNNKNR